MFYVQLAPLGGILGPLKSDLGLFLPCRAINFKRQKHTFCKKGLFPQQIWLKTCVSTPKHLPDLNPRAGKWAIPSSKISLRLGVGGSKGKVFGKSLLFTLRLPLAPSTLLWLLLTSSKSFWLPLLPLPFSGSLWLRLAH